MKKKKIIIFSNSSKIKFDDRSGSRYNPWTEIQSNTKNGPKIHTPSTYVQYLNGNPIKNTNKLLKTKKGNPAIYII